MADNHEVCRPICVNRIGVDAQWRGEAERFILNSMQRQKLKDALQKRDEMEARMKEIIAYLTQPGSEWVIFCEV